MHPLNLDSRSGSAAIWEAGIFAGQSTFPIIPVPQEARIGASRRENVL